MSPIESLLRRPLCSSRPSPSEAPPARPFAGARRGLPLSACAIALAWLVSGCDFADREDHAGSDVQTGSDTERSPASGAATGSGGTSAAPVPRDPLKQAYYGDLHVHTGWSLDAFAFGVRATPTDAYRHARGEAIEHVSGVSVKLAGPPLDFIAVTEHANYLGVASQAMAPDGEARGIPMIADLVGDDAEKRRAANFAVLGMLSADRIEPELNRTDWAQSTWQELVRLADQHDDPGEFTAFVGYEYTPMPEGQNLHRNVIFRGSDVPVRPFSDLDSKNPEDLWRWMDAARAAGDDLLAIPHNANGSNGLMFERVDRAGRPIDAEYAEIRLRNEPIAEVYQIKGQSEAHPALSPADEWAGFEMLEGILGRPAVKSRPQGSYVRRALMDGLELAASGLPNPYRLGQIGSSDGHNATSPTEEDNFTGKLGVLDGSPEARLSLADGENPTVGDATTGSPFSAAGLAGVWAHSNTRADLFDAMKAREVFATSGPRIAVRFFGGFGLATADLASGIAAAGYERGVPMGGVGPGEGRRRAPRHVPRRSDPGSARSAPRKTPAREGLDRPRRPGDRKGLRRRLRRRRGAGSANASLRAGEPAAGSRDLRRRRGPGGVAALGRGRRARLPARRAELLLRPRAGGPDLSLEQLGCPPAEGASPARSRRLPAGAGGDLADLGRARRSERGLGLERRRPSDRSFRRDRALMGDCLRDKPAIPPILEVL